MYRETFTDRKKLLQGLAACVLSLTLAACTTTTTQSFNVAQNAKVESAQIATDADFGKYNQLLAKDMGIYFPPNAAPSLEDQKRIRQIFRSAFLSRLDDYRIVDQPGPTTMTVQASLIDLRNSSGGTVTYLRPELRDMAKPGSLVFLMEFQDSLTSKTLGRAADSTSAPAFATAASATDWDSVEEAANHWAELFVTFLDNNLGH